MLDYFLNIFNSDELLIKASRAFYFSINTSNCTNDKLNQFSITTNGKFEANVVSSFNASWGFVYKLRQF